MDGQLRCPLGSLTVARMRGHGLTTVVTRVVVNEGFLLGLGTGDVMVMRAAGDMVVVFRADGVTRAGWHLDRGHDWAHVVMVGTELTMCIMVSMMLLVSTTHRTYHGPWSHAMTM